MNKQHHQECIFIRPFKFLAGWRSLPLYEMISYALMFASVPMLAYGFLLPYTTQMFYIILITTITLYAGFFAALIWNDITDLDIDTKVHPDRPIPSGKISTKRFFGIALVFSGITFLGSILLGFWCFLLVIGAALFVTFHNKYLKKLVKIPAYSEIVTPIQWIVVALFGYTAIWTKFPQLISTNELQNMLLLVLFIYFTDNAHDIPEGIHDAEGDRLLNVRTYTTSFGEKTAAAVSFLWFILSAVSGTLLFVRTSLGIVFYIPFILLWIYTISYSFRLLRKNVVDMRYYGSIVGRKGFNLLLFSFDLMFLDLLIHLIFTPTLL